ncbi:glutathione synthase/RimK-type ligase-like ATP-grasp enzyme [Saccharothrix tamanrassetensis]|uniref:Glutathione synthase/RimK-type ligase-like ATP-grasp enzyme n=1 Tax=Saccharothrix tamanrassetensis TaxID=1051531 RepID=A0A841CQX4_9PSEU|nr:hypothetical protein [Saccharothrix tamanrassetensis]MBB5958447.1 glutathione synthase/RimK-type ligase-like ATP-grasp enzyme [Saccharothrix tamanrassetensis]
MNDSAILIVTARWDSTAFAGAEILRRNGRTPFLFFPEDFPQRAQLSADFRQGRWSSRLRTDDGTIDLDNVKAVWWRKPLPNRPPRSLPPVEFPYARRENDYALRGLWDLLLADPDVYWMNSPWSIRRADDKLLQMSRAAAHGLESPRTIVTNDPERVRAFYDECSGEMVFKSMTGPFLVPGQVDEFKFQVDMPGIPLVRPFTTEDMANVGSARHNACMFQELVEKKHELRVTVFEDQVFTCEIRSQESDLTRYDWRRQDAPPKAVAGDLPEPVAAACLALMEEFDLRYAAFDFIVTPDDRHVFLEMNPNGQWLFVQEWVPQLRLMQAFVDIMVRNS